MGDKVKTGVTIYAEFLFFFNYCRKMYILDPEGGSQKATLVVQVLLLLLVVVISSFRIQKSLRLS